MVIAEPIAPLRAVPLSSRLADLQGGKDSIFSPVEDVEDVLKIARITSANARLYVRDIPAGHAVFENLKGNDRDTVILKRDRVFSLDVGDHVVTSFEQFREYFVFVSRLLDVSNHLITLERPDRVFVVRYRDLDRSMIPPDATVKVDLREVSARRRFTGNVIDMSPKGLGVILEDQRGELNRILSSERNVVIEMHLPWNSMIEHVPARVVQWQSVQDEKMLRVGVACAIPMALGDQHSLEDFLLDQRYPNVIRARTDEDYREVWRLINLAYQSFTPADTSKTDTSIITWKKASWSPHPINRVYLLRRNHGNEGTTEYVGTIATSRYCYKTWLIHQLGVDGSKGQVLSHQLYGRVVDYLRQTDVVKYVFGTFPKDSHVFRKYYVEFIQNDPDQEFHYLEETHILEFKVTDALKNVSGGRSDFIRVVSLERRHERVLMKELRQRFPRLFLNAMDLRNFDLLFTDVGALYEKVALRRERRIFVAECQGEIVGFSILERGSEDQNVFSLFDNFRLFSITPDREKSRLTKRELLRVIFESYSRANVRTVISWTKDLELLDLAPSGRVFHDAYFWIADHNRMRPFLRHLDRLHGRVHAIRQERMNRHSPVKRDPE